MRHTISYINVDPWKKIEHPLAAIAITSGNNQTLSLTVMADQLTCGFDNRLKKEIK